jgi:hypothetical protein
MHELNAISGFRGFRSPALGFGYALVETKVPGELSTEPIPLYSPGFVRASAKGAHEPQSVGPIPLRQQGVGLSSSHAVGAALILPDDPRRAPKRRPH